MSLLDGRQYPLIVNSSLYINETKYIDHVEQVRSCSCDHDFTGQRLSSGFKIVMANHDAYTTQ